MTFRKISYILALVGLLTALSGTARADRFPIITFEYPPYMTGNGVGLVERIFEAMAQASGQDVTFHIYPRKRALITFEQAGTRDMFLGERIYFPDLARDLEFLEIIRINSVFVYLKERYPSFSFQDLTDLSGKRVGISLGSIYVPLFKSKGIRVDEAGLENNLLKLMDRRIDFWHTVDFAAQTLIKRKGLDIHAFGMVPDQSHTVELMVKKGSPAEAAFRALARGLAEIRKNGRFDELLQELH